MDQNGNSPVPCKRILQGIAITNANTIGPCCEFNLVEPIWAAELNLRKHSLTDYFNSKKVIRLNQDLNNGIKDSHCQHCWNIEEAGRGKSKRQHSNEFMTDDDFLYNFRVGNTCNLQCYTCNPTSSSKIAQERKIISLIPNNVINDAAGYDWDEDLQFKALESVIDKITLITITGGEPFYFKDSNKLLQLLNSKKFKEISIVTNGSVLPLESLKTLDNLILTFSIDAIGDRAGYVRFGSNWNQIKNNLTKAGNDLTLARLHSSITVSNYNIFSLSETLEFLLNLKGFEHYHIGFAFGIYGFTVDTLPPDLSQLAIEEVDRGISIVNNFSKNENNKNYLNENLNTLKTLIGKNYTPEKFELFLKYTKLLDNNRHVKLTDHYPEYKKYYETI